MKRIEHPTEKVAVISFDEFGDKVLVGVPRLLTRAEYRAELRPIQAAAIAAARIQPVIDDKGDVKTVAPRNRQGSVIPGTPGFLLIGKGGNRHERRRQARVVGGRTVKLVYGKASAPTPAYETYEYEVAA